MTAERPEWAALKAAGSKVAEAHEALKVALREYAEAQARVFERAPRDAE